MMLDSVPGFSSLWLGTGTVVVVSPARFCITIWLPRRRTSTNPRSARTRQTSSPDRTRSLPNEYLDLRDENLAVEAPGDFRGIRGLEEQLQRFDQVLPCGFHRFALARDVQLGTEGDIRVVFALDDGGQLTCGFHDRYSTASKAGAAPASFGASQIVAGRKQQVVTAGCNRVSGSDLPGRWVAKNTLGRSDTYPTRRSAATRGEYGD